MIYSWLTTDQLSWMWTALTQWGSWLLHIGIQIMPYAIAFTIILIIFKLIKNRSNLKNNYWWEKMYSRWQYQIAYPWATKKEYRSYKRFYRSN